MDEQQFAQFIEAERLARERELAAAATHHRERQLALAEQSEREKAEAQIRKIIPCDGGTTRAVRHLIQGVELTIPYTVYTVYVASQSAEGPLKREIEHFLDSAQDRNNVTWDQLKQHLQASFLSRHEAEQLRDAVEWVRQNDYETCATYGRRFREAADLGYPPATRNADQKRHLLRTYMRGLRDRQLVERLIKEGKPADLAAAMDLVAQYESDEYIYIKTLKGMLDIRNEEPMEVGAIGGTRQTSALQEGVKDKAITDLQRQVSGLSKQFTKLMAITEGKSKQDKGRRKFRYTKEGKPICNACQKPGHVWRECTAKQGPPKHSGGQ